MKLGEIQMDWLELKALSSQIGLEKDALHIYLGFLIQILAAMVLRRSLSNWIPWAVVLLAAMVNEVLDLQTPGDNPVERWQILGARHDIVNTMILPSLLLVLCRFAPRLFARPSCPAQAPPSATAPESSDGSPRT
jgi:hypothetical protein